MSKPSDEAVRKEFEAWHGEQTIDIFRGHIDYRGWRYESPIVQNRFEVWQAARSAAIQECAEHIREHWGADTIVGKTSAESLLALKEI